MRAVLFVLAVVVGLALGSSCGGTEGFACQSDVQCITDEVQGQCEAQGVCSFPDLGCDSGHRYGEQAGELAGMCVDEPSTGTGDGTGSGTVTGPGMGSTTTTADADTSGSGSSDVPPATTGPPVDDPYGSCSSDEDCTDPDAICLPFGPSFVCAPWCTEPAYPSDECPADPQMLALPECVSLGDGDTRCALSCVETMRCPDGMVCEVLMGQAYCVWG